MLHPGAGIPQLLSATASVTLPNPRMTKAAKLHTARPVKRNLRSAITARRIACRHASSAIETVLACWAISAGVVRARDGQEKRLSLGSEPVERGVMARMSQKRVSSPAMNEDGRSTQHGLRAQGEHTSGFRGRGPRS